MSVMTYPNPHGHGPDVPAGGTETDGKMLVPGQHVNHPNEGPGENYSRPAQYDGPPVVEQAPLVNPSAGTQGDAGGGVNPRGPDVYSPGDQPTASHGNAPFPNTTAADPPSRGPARPGPR